MRLRMGSDPNGTYLEASETEISPPWLRRGALG
jgi:hypothetical protein